MASTSGASTLMIPRDVLARVADAADLVELVEAAGVQLQRRGQNLVGLCPFHQQQTPSFSVSPSRGKWKCFGCDAGGDVFAFVQRAEGMKFPEAVRHVAARFGVDIPDAEDNDQRR